MTLYKLALQGKSKQFSVFSFLFCVFFCCCWLFLSSLHIAKHQLEPWRSDVVGCTLRSRQHADLAACASHFAQQLPKWTLKFTGATRRSDISSTVNQFEPVIVVSRRNECPPKRQHYIPPPHFLLLFLLPPFLAQVPLDTFCRGWQNL